MTGVGMTGGRGAAAGRLTCDSLAGRKWRVRNAGRAQHRVDGDRAAGGEQGDERGEDGAAAGA